MNIYIRRKFINFFMLSICSLSALLTIIPLISIFFYIISQGISNINIDFLTKLPKPVGEPGGGIGNAIIGTLILIALSSIWAIPLSILGGIYLSEFGNNKLSNIIRFTADVLSGVPSIVIGIFSYTIIVLPMKRFSAISGGIALGIMMIPTIIRTTEETLKMVPQNLREAGLALGLSRFRTTLSIVLKTAIGGILAGVMLAIARIAGETAPLLFTAFGNNFGYQGLDHPIAALPLQIFIYAISPFEEWHKQAWAGAFVLITIVFLINLMSKIFMRRRYILNE